MVRFDCTPTCAPGSGWRRSGGGWDEQLFAAQKLESLGVLAGGIAHDFNNLLTAMLGHASLVRLDLPEGSPAHEGLAQIELAAQRAAELSKQMLAYSGRGQFVVQRVSMNQVVTELAQLLQVATVKMAVLRFHLAEQLPLVIADITQIRQVVMNLITNASDAIGEHSGVISLTTALVVAEPAYLREFMTFGALPAGPYVSLEVRDTGAGMDATTQARIFEPSSQQSSRVAGLG